MDLLFVQAPEPARPLDAPAPLALHAPHLGKIHGGQPWAKQLPPVVPIVLHHGKQGWTAARDLAGLVKIPGGMAEAMEPYLPGFTFELVDLVDTDFKDIRGSVLVRLAMQALKAASEDRLEEFMQVGGQLLAEVFQATNTLEIATALLRYLHDTDTSIDKQTFMDMVLNLNSQPTDKVEMTLRLAENGMETAQIATLTGLPESTVRRFLEQGN